MRADPLSPQPSGHWTDPFYAWRDRLLTSPAFRAGAERFWPTRWVARRRAARLFDLCAGFVYSQVLLASLRCGLLERLASGPMTEAALAPALGLPAPAAARLLRAAGALDLIERRPGDRWGLGALGAPLVGNAGLTALVAHHAPLYRDLADPVALLRRGRGGELAETWPYAKTHQPLQLPPEAVAEYSSVMAASQPEVARQLFHAYPVAGRRRWLDLGGGEGAFAELLAREAPALDITVFDLPAVAQRAALRLAPLGPRCRAVGGSFFEGDWPQHPDGFDAISLVRVLHDHDDAAVLALLRRARSRLAPGGHLLVLEPMVDGHAAMADAYFGLYLWAMGTGRARSTAELTALLREAGFTSVRRVPTGLPLVAGLLQSMV